LPLWVSQHNNIFCLLLKTVSTKTNIALDVEING
jgi:hypothetical protein